MTNTTEVIAKLRMAQVSSCACLTKTNEASYHDADCLYRVLSEAISAITTPSADHCEDAPHMVGPVVERQPFFYGIMQPDGKPHYSELCVSGEASDLESEVESMNEDSVGYRVVALYTSQPAPVSVLPERLTAAELEELEVIEVLLHGQGLSNLAGTMAAARQFIDEVACLDKPTNKEGAQ